MKKASGQVPEMWEEAAGGRSSGVVNGKNERKMEWKRNEEVHQCLAAREPTSQNAETIKYINNGESPQVTMWAEIEGGSDEKKPWSDRWNEKISTSCMPGDATVLYPK
jgi:hypothetical protein